MRLGLVAALSALVLLVVQHPAPESSAAGEALVRLVHASPDGPALDIYLDEGQAPLRSGVRFFTASEYITLPAGTHRFRFARAGEPASAALIDRTDVLEAGRAYAIAAINPAASIAGKLFPDDLTPPARGNGRLRVYHLSPDTQPLGLRIRGGPVLVTSLAYPNASGYLERPAGAADLQLTVANSPNLALLTLEDFPVEQGYISSIFVVGFFTPPSGQPGLRAETRMTPVDLPSRYYMPVVSK